MRHLSWISVCTLLAVGGCATRPTASTLKTPAVAATRPNDPAMLTLGEIEPPLVLPAPATQPTTRPSLDAIHLYAQARAAQLRGDRPVALSLLNSALKLDPNSFDLNYALAQAHLSGSGGQDLAIKALERAASVQPDHLEVQLLLGRQYLARGDMTQALEHLRLAVQTSDYTAQPEIAALVDLFLARALQQAGYDRAAADQYERLVMRLQQRLNVRGNPELFYLVSRPEAIFVQIGELHEKHGRYQEALKFYRSAAEHEPNNFDYQSHVIHALLGLGQTETARQMAADLVSTHQASSESLDLLKEVYKSSGGEQAMVNGLRRILKDRPSDRSILFALADALNTGGKPAEAEKLLADAMTRNPGDAIVAMRLFELLLERDNTPAAARLVVETLAKHPDLLSRLEPMWDRLLRLSSRNRLRLPMLQQLSISPDAAAAKLYLTARLAETYGRDSLSRASLQQAAAAKPPFAPAYRDLLQDILDREQWSESQKSEAAGRLIEQLKKQDSPGLAAELRGLLLLHQKQLPEAVTALEDAIRLGDKGPAAQYALAAVLLEQGKDLQAEAQLWKITGEWSSFDEAYLSLFRYYLNKGDRRSGEQALKVLHGWLAADPSNVNARLLQATIFAQGSRLDLAETTLLGLFAEQPDSSEVITELYRFYMRANRSEQFIHHLEEHRIKHPDNRMVVEMLATLHMEQKHPTEAKRVVDAMRAAVGDDTDQLYFIAQLYDRVGQRPMTERLLLEILKLEPHSGASNDLGYMWAEEGKNLEKAESLIRAAVRAEPDNSAYLDSLGWVLYKRGKFAESHRCLKEAVDSAGKPDPVVLDHLGDALYRLQQAQEAATIWRRSLDRMSEIRQSREDLKKLQLQLKRKLQQYETGQSVDVAPVAENSKEPAQAEVR
ncbi:MAG TPA: tetratricopeptide repeat protein [Tepidisphaeraceae bacterium]|nr:tetratricopeptide repeat protein [Tepidisphaeraceae bacterium]